jgi:hypothetical protein
MILKEKTEALPKATLIVGSVTSLVQQEIEELDGNVSQIGKDPDLFRVQIPHSQWVSTHPEDWDNEMQERPAHARDDIEIGVKDGQGYLLLRSDGWMCEYNQHPYDVTQTSLCSLDDPLEEREEENPVSLLPDHIPVLRRRQERQERQGDVSLKYALIASSVRNDELTLYQRHIWAIAQSPQTFPDNTSLRQGLQALITMDAYNAPFCKEAVGAIQGELDTLNYATTLQKIGILIDEIQDEAEVSFRMLSLEEQYTIVRFELEQRLAALRLHQLSDQEIETAIEGFGVMHMLEACPDVERFLSHHSPGLRQRTLSTFLYYWRLPEYAEAAFQFLRDKDSDCRWQGIRCLNPSGEICDDLRVLQAYACIITNQDEDSFLRLDAYNEFLMAIGYQLDDETWQRMEDALEEDEVFEQVPSINWELVRFFLEEKSERCSLQFALSSIQKAARQGWEDHDGRFFETFDQLVSEILRPAHVAASARFQRYCVTITLSPDD